jgi:hypothetical protein
MALNSSNQKIVWDYLVHNDKTGETKLSKYVTDFLRQLGLSLLNQSVAVSGGEITYGGFDKLPESLKIPALKDITEVDEFWFHLAINRNHLKALVAYNQAFEGELFELPESLDIFRELTRNPNTSPSIIDTYIGLSMDSELPERAIEIEPEEMDYFESLALHPNLTAWGREELHAMFAHGGGSGGELNIVLDLLRNPSITDEDAFKILDLYWSGFMGSDDEIQQSLKAIITLIEELGYEKHIKALIQESFEAHFGK